MLELREAQQFHDWRSSRGCLRFRIALSERPGISSGGDTHVSPRLFSEPLPKRRVFLEIVIHSFFGLPAPVEKRSPTPLSISASTRSRGSLSSNRAFESVAKILPSIFNASAPNPPAPSRARGAAPSSDERLEKRCRGRFAGYPHVETVAASPGRFATAAKRADVVRLRACLASIRANQATRFAYGAPAPPIPGLT